MNFRVIVIWSSFFVTAPSLAVVAGKYVEVPLKGAFGEEITADGVSRCLDFAKRKGANSIVFVIDSPGGTLRDAEAISAVLQASHKEFKYAAVVRKALSASVWVLANCDTIGFMPGSASGAAVIFADTRADTGSVEVDAKFNSAMAATLASLADANGQSGAVYKAMMVLDESLYAVPGENGAFTLTNTEPAEAPAGLVALDTAATVLTLTAAEATKYGFGRSVRDASDTVLGTALGFETWTRVDTPQSAQNIFKSSRQSIEVARSLIKRAESALQDKLALRERLVGELAARVRDAEKESPQSVVRVYANPHTGIMSQSSQSRWQQQTDLCIREWKNVHKALARIRTLQDEIAQAAKQLDRERAALHKLCRWTDAFQSTECPAFTDQGELDEHWTRAQAEIDALIARRNRTRADQ